DRLAGDHQHGRGVHAMELLAASADRGHVLDRQQRDAAPDRPARLAGTRRGAGTVAVGRDDPRVGRRGGRGPEMTPRGAPGGAPPGPRTRGWAPTPPVRRRAGRPAPRRGRGAGGGGGGWSGRGGGGGGPPRKASGVPPPWGAAATPPMRNRLCITHQPGRRTTSNLARWPSQPRARAVIRSPRALVISNER